METPDFSIPAFILFTQISMSIHNYHWFHSTFFPARHRSWQKGQFTGVGKKKKKSLPSLSSLLWDHIINMHICSTVSLGIQFSVGLQLVPTTRSQWKWRKQSVWICNTHLKTAQLLSSYLLFFFKWQSIYIFKRWVTPNNNSHLSLPTGKWGGASQAF